MRWAEILLLWIWWNFEWRLFHNHTHSYNMPVITVFISNSWMWMHLIFEAYGYHINTRILEYYEWWLWVVFNTTYILHYAMFLIWYPNRYIYIYHYMLKYLFLSKTIHTSMTDYDVFSFKITNPEGRRCAIWGQYLR